MSEIRYTNNKHQIIDGLITDQEVNLKDLSVNPSNPNSGYQTLFSKNDGKIYSKNNSGVVTDLTTVTDPFNSAIQGALPLYTGVNSTSIGRYCIKDSTNTSYITPNSISSTLNYYNWDFNEGSGTTISANKGGTNTNLTTSGTVTWGTDNLSVNGISGANSFAGANGFMSQLNSFSICLWFEWNGTSINNWFLAIGDGTGTANSNISFGFTRQDSGGMGASVNSGSAGTIITSGVQPTNGVKYFCVATYQRVGGAGNNILTFNFTADGTTWYRASSSTAVLMQRNVNHELRSSIISNFTNSTNGKYYRLIVLPDKILTNDEMQSLFNIGSEGSLSTFVSSSTDTTNVFCGDPIPYDWAFNESGGTTASANKGGSTTTFTLSGTASLGSGYLSVSNAGAATLPTVGLGTPETFSIACWVEFNAVPANAQYFLNFGSGANAAYRFLFGHTAGQIPTCFIRNDSNVDTSLSLTGFTLTTGVKYLYILTYEYISSGSNNLLSFSVTRDGATWYTNSTNTSVAIGWNSAYSWRTNYDSAGSQSSNCRIHRLQIYNEKILTQSEIQQIWDNGSESAVSPNQYGGLNACLYSSLSGTVSVTSASNIVTGTGTSFLTDFQPGDSITVLNETMPILSVQSNTSLLTGNSDGTVVNFTETHTSCPYQRGGIGLGNFGYLYNVTNDTTPGFVISTRSTSNNDILVDLPSGYTKYRQLPFAFCKPTFLSKVSPFRVDGSWPIQPTVYLEGTYSTTPLPNNITTLNSTTTNPYARFSISRNLPKISLQPLLYLRNNGVSSSIFFSSQPIQNTSDEIGITINTTTGFTGFYSVKCDTSQYIYYRVTASTWEASIAGYTVTGVI